MRARGRMHTWCHAGETGQSRAAWRAEPARSGAAGQDGHMSELKDRLRADLTAAMKARDEVRTRTLRMALTAVANEEVAGKSARELSDDEVLKVLTREAKRRREAASAFEDAGLATDDRANFTLADEAIAKVRKQRQIVAAEKAGKLQFARRRQMPQVVERDLAGVSLVFLAGIDGVVKIRHVDGHQARNHRSAIVADTEQR